MKNFLLFFLWAMFLWVNTAVHAADMTATLKDNTANSGFSVVNASGTTTARFRGDGNVGVGTTTPSARFMIVGSSTSSGDASLIIRTGSSNDVVYVRNDGKVGIGTTTPSSILHVNGTVTATYFSGNGSGLTGISASPGADSVSSSSIVDGSISGSDLASTLSMSAKSLDIGSITVNAGSFRVDSTGSMTASAVKATGTMTIGGAILRNTGIVLGTGGSTHVNLGVSSTSGSTTDNYTGCTISGGNSNTASNQYATVGGGYSNTASGQASYIGGGWYNSASSDNATIGGGDTNTASNYYATVGGGQNNTASGQYATVGGGWNNTAAGDYSWAGGKRMQLSSNADNSFVWGIAGSPFSIDTADAFLIFPNATGATGMVGIGTSTPQTKLHVIGTVTATYFSGNGSGLSGISASPGADSVSSSSIIDGSISGSDLASSISISTTGTMSVAGGGFVVDSTGSMTAATVNSSGTITANGNLIVDSSTLFVDSANNRVGIGTTTPQSALTVDGTVTISGNKLITWANDTTNTFLGVGAGGNSSTGMGANTANGYRALYSNTSGYNNIAYGYRALYSNTTGYNNVANGYQALYSNTSGTLNVANGNYALYSNTTGTDNSANGIYALYSNTTGNYNTANGNLTLRYHTTGIENTADGFSALYSNTSGSNNTANGSNALYSNTTGTYNTANGNYALFSNLTGNSNVADGYQALYSNFKGNYNTANGCQAGYNALGSKNVFIGYQAGYNETGTSTLYIANGSSSTLIYGNFGSGTVGIGTTTPSTTLHVIGTVTATYFSGNGSGLSGISASPGADSVSSSSIQDGSISGSDLASTLSMLTKSLDIGSITVNAGNFRVDSTGSMTASTITSTGSVTASAITTTGTLTASGNLNIDSGTLFVDSANNRVGVGTTTPQTAFAVVGTMSISGNNLITFANDTTNTFLGVRAGNPNVTGSSNTAIGDAVLHSNTTGVSNTGIGSGALYLNTTGENNTANGDSALGLNSIGSDNTACGVGALNLNTSGSRNVADGKLSLRSNNTGNNNTALGYMAGYSTTGTGSVFLGYQAGYNETGSNKLYIANGSSSTLIYGDFTNTKVGIGTTTPSTTLHVNGTVTATYFSGNGSGLTNISASPGADSVSSSSIVDGSISGSDLASTLTMTSQTLNIGSITVNAGNFRVDSAGSMTASTINATGTITAAGNLAVNGTTTISGNKLITWASNTTNTFLGVGAGGTSTTGSYNTANGYRALYSNTSGYSNNANGYQSLYSNTTGYKNTAHGVSALFSNTTGRENAATGGWALYSNTTGEGNTAHGYTALYSNTTGYENTANGSYALWSNSTGYNNTAHGYYALYFNTTGYGNTVCGYYAQQSNTTGNYNTSIGWKALYSNNESNNNTAVGREAGYNALGSGNVFLGYQAGYNETGTNTLYIGSGSSTTLVYGNFSTARVGIGTTTPSTTLHVIGTVTATGFVGNGSQLTGISASPGADSVSSSSIVDGSISGSDMASTLSMSTKSLDIGSITVNAGNFRVDSTGSVTATTITSTGSVTASAITTTGTLTASGNLNIDSGTLFVDAVNNRVGIGTIIPQTALSIVGTVTVSGNNVVTYSNDTTNTFIGVGAGNSNDIGDDNTAFGFRALYSNFDGYQNTAIGDRSLYFNDDGFDNTAVGFSALYSNISGADNTANGRYALYSNTDGSANVANGVQALLNNTTGSDNTACGYDALVSNTTASSNTANGLQSLYSNTKGSANTAIGKRALYSNITGNNNAAIGFQSGYSTLGSGNVFLGYNAGYNETGTNTLYIANSSGNTLIYGNFGSTTVGIGTTTPSTTLHVIGTVTATYFSGNGSGLSGISASPGANSVSSSTITDGSITGSDLASTLTMTSQALDIGSITVNAGNFRVDSTGSMTASAITSTGSVTASAITTTGTLTASGNLNIDSGTLFVDSANNRVGVGTTTPQTAFAVSGTATVTNGYFGIGTNNPGARLTIHTNGVETGSGGLGFTDGSSTAYLTLVHTGSVYYISANAHVFHNSSLYEIFRATSDGKMGVGTDTPQTKLHVIGTVTATGFSGDGSQLTGITATVGTNSVSTASITDGSVYSADIADNTITGSDLASSISINTTGTMSVASGAFVVDSSGSITASSIASTGTMTVGGALVKSGSTLIGIYSNTHVNLGVSSTTGTASSDREYATVGGGYSNTASGTKATVGGGGNNTASGLGATVGGGISNLAAYSGEGGYVTIGGGFSNTASYDRATVGGGYSNTASGNATTVGGGFSNTASGSNATISGGNNNTASGDYATVGGGYYNTAAGDYSWAGGANMQLTANADNTFVWGTSTDAVSIATADAFLIFPNATGATGRVGIGTSTPQTKLVVVGTITASAGDIRVTGGSFIDDGTTLDVPDYVFDSDYPLKPLAQVKAYTQEHRHLEGIPDMNDKKGWASLSMQDRDMKLLEKVEELTLYLIQMKEENVTLHTANDALKARISALEMSRMGETQCTHQ